MKEVDSFRGRRCICGDCEGDHIHNDDGSCGGRMCRATGLVCMAYEEVEAEE